MDSLFNDHCNGQKDDKQLVEPHRDSGRNASFAIPVLRTNKSPAHPVLTIVFLAFALITSVMARLSIVGARCFLACADICSTGIFSWPAHTIRTLHFPIEPRDVV